MAAEDANAKRDAIKVTPFELYRTYTLISLLGFGGTFFWVHRLLVEKKRWLTNAEFVEFLTMGQLVPGANIFNMALMVGHRYAGVAGAAAAGLGFMGVSFLVMIGIGVAYRHFGDLPVVRQALAGMSAVAAGLLLANGVKLSIAMRRTLRPWAFASVAFVCVGVLRLPLVAVVVVLAPLALAAVWRELD